MISVKSIAGRKHQRKRFKMKRGRSLAVRRHLRFFEDDVLAHDRIELLEFELVGLGALVLLRVVRIASAGRRNEADVFAHGSGVLSRDFCARNLKLRDFSACFAISRTPNRALSRLLPPAPANQTQEPQKSR